MVHMDEEILKEHCRQLIEEKLGWGNCDRWTNQDFDHLTEKIYDSTGVSLSQTTLKRIWGKVKYDSEPAVTTLNTLAKFLDFENWRDFRQKQEELLEKAVPNQPPLPAPPEKIPGRKKRFYIAAAGVFILTLLAIISWNLFSSKAVGKSPGNTAGEYQFTSKKIVSSGLPNSVVFEYDATAAPDDSVYIQQSWDSRRRDRVSREQHLHSSIYYYPGFFNAKLIVDGRVVKEHPVFIRTDGWLSLAEQDPVPVYFKKEETIENGKMGLTVEKLKSQGIDMKPIAPIVFYGNIREFGDLKTDDLVFESALKNNFSEGSGICQKTEIRLLCEGSMISIPLSAHGCISENNLFCLGYLKKGNENDLSGFGVDFNGYVKVRLEIAGGHAKFFINEKMVYQVSHITMASRIKGIVFRFQGTGSVDWVRLSKTNGEKVYDEEF